MELDPTKFSPTSTAVPGSHPSKTFSDVPCDFCASQSVKPVAHQWDYVYKTSDEYFKYVRCESCELVFLSPRPNENEMSKYYPDSYSFYREGALDGFKEQIKEVIYREYFCGLNTLTFFLRGLLLPVYWLLKKRGLLNFIRQYRTYPFLSGLQSGRLLDVGCGSGTTLSPYGRKYSLKWLSTKGYQCEGVEISPNAVKIARSKGLQIHQGYFDRVDLPVNSYDVVRMNYSLEHVHSPKSYLRKAYQVLKPGGILIVSVPNFGGLNNSLFPDALEVPRHLYYFTQKTLQQYLEELNFKVENFKTDPSPEVLMFTLENHPGLKGASLIEPDTLFKWLPMYESLAKIGLGDDMTFVARKPLL
jgi:SAM-dependent methyltransferase